MNWTQFVLMMIIVAIMTVDFMQAGIAYTVTSKHWSRVLFRGILLGIFLAFVHSMIG